MPAGTPALHFQNYFAELLAIFQAGVGFGGFFERIDFVDYWIQDASVYQLQNRIEFGFAAHEAA